MLEEILRRICEEADQHADRWNRESRYMERGAKHPAVKSLSGVRSCVSLKLKHGIEISANAIDVIQVKDNGHGIPSDDHACVCRRTFTSKIQTVEDLRTLGGKSLGFRGEALASAAEVSGGVTITTRVEAEMVGTSIKYGRNGELISSQRASHPVGTTVRITDLFKHIPVRRQSTLKSAMKTLPRIKKLIQIYAMAQPSKRLSFKVLKAKNESNNWIYAPGRDTTITDAALKVAGTDVTSSCVLKKWPSEENVNSEPHQEEHTSELRLLALLLDIETATEEPSGDDQEEPPLSQLAHERFRSQEQSSPELCEIASRTISIRRGSGNSTPESPALSSIQSQNPTSRVSSQGPASEVREKRQEFPVLEQWSSRLHNLAKDSPKSDLETALDFEHRKKEAIQRRREIKGRSQLPASTNSPHLSRYLAARAALRPESNQSVHKLSLSTSAEVTTKSGLNPHDPRSYLIRHQDTSRQDELSRDGKVRRINTNKLPFERIPEGHELHDIGINLSATLPALSALSEEVCQSDLYTQCGEQFEAFSACDLQSDLVTLWTSRLSALLKSKYKAKEGSEEITPRFDFSALTETNNGQK
ncbi:hypothetical protein APSETT445_002216 [Aspergillus pseudonomiae]